MEECKHANLVEGPLSSALALAPNPSRRVARAGCRWCFDYRGAAGAAGIRAAALSHGRISLDTWLLGISRWRLLLDAGIVGCASTSRIALDARLLGVRGRRLLLAWGLLGTARGILRRN